MTERFEHVGTAGRPIRVLVVDDSAFMRKVITQILSYDPDIQVVGTARNGEEGLRKTAELRPDVITLDVEMPGMDGLTMLRKVVAEFATPVVMLSSLTQEGADITVRALAAGAVDFVGKPSGAISLNLTDVGDEIVRKVKLAAGARVRPGVGLALRREARLGASLAQPSGQAGRAGGVWAATETTETPAPSASSVTSSKPAPQGLASKVVVIGSSTGGPRALMSVVPHLPPNLPAAVLIIQHMPAGFTASLARRLDEASAITVKEAENGEPLGPSTAYLAPGGVHMLVTREKTIELAMLPPVHGVRPAVDMTMMGLPDVFGSSIVACVLTGMGSDGAAGAQHIRGHGGKVIAEDASTCVVYGMPRSVVELGGADYVLPIDKVADAVVDAVLSLGR